MQQDPVVALEHDREPFISTSNSNVRPAAIHQPRAAALITTPSIATSRMKWLASASFILCSSSARRWWGPFGWRVQPGVEQRKRAAAQQPLHEPHSKKLVQPWVTLEVA